MLELSSSPSASLSASNILRWLVSPYDDVALADGKILSKQNSSRAASIADVMRHGKLERYRAGDVSEAKR
jgi:hypothetical protein